MFKQSIYLSILDSRDMVLSQRSEEFGASKSFLLKKLKTTRHSRFTPTNQEKTSDQSSMKSSLMGALVKRNTIQTPEKTIKLRSEMDLENVDSDICLDSHKIGNMIVKYSTAGAKGGLKTSIR